MVALKQLLVVVATLIWMPPAFAEPDASSANWLMEGCKSAILREGGASPDRHMAFKRGICLGQIAAIRYFGSSLETQPKPCVPPETTIIQLTKVVVAYLDQQPKRLHLSFLFLAEEALSETWPCKK